MRYLLLLWLGLPAWGANLLKNSSFESGDLSGWSYGGGFGVNVIPLYYTNLAAFHGSNCVRLENSKSNQNQVLASQPVQVEAGDHVISYYARLEVAGAPSPLDINIYDTKTGQYLLNAGGYVSTTSWVRYGGLFNMTNRSTVYVQVVPHWNTSYSGDTPGVYLYLDAFQLETTSTNAYAPQSPVEIGVNLNRGVAGHIWQDGGTIALPLLVWNDTANSSNLNVSYRVWDHYNALAGSNIISHVATAGRSTNLISVNPGQRGGFRVQIWTTNAPYSLSEYNAALVPTPVVLGNRTNGHFGTTTHHSAWSLENASRLGFHWNRLFSASSLGRWAIAEPNEGEFHDDTNGMRLHRTWDIEPVLQIGWQTGSDTVPAFGVWGSNPGIGYPQPTYWSNWVYHIVKTYSNYTKYYGLWNEDANLLERGFTNVAIFARGAISAVDPNAVMVAPDEFYYTSISNAIVATGTTNWLDIWSAHNYPENTHAAPTTAAYAAYFQRDWWNTETGFRINNYRRDFLYEDLYGFGGDKPTAGGFARDHPYKDPFNAYSKVGSISQGAKAHFYYDQRATGGYNFAIAYSIMDFDQTARSGAAMHGWINWCMDGNDTVTTGAATGIPACLQYLFGWSRSNQVWFCAFPTNSIDFYSVLANVPLSPKIWSQSSDATVTFYDLYGNTLPNTGTKFGRGPLFIAGASGMASNTLRAALTFYTTNDSVAPKLSFTSFPTGGETNNFRFRWFGIDDAALDTLDVVNTTNAIRYQYQVNSGAWSILTNYPSVNVSTTNLTSFVVAATDPEGNWSTNTWPFSIASPASGGGIIYIRDLTVIH